MRADEYFLDTNIFVRFFVRDSQRAFEECRDFFEALRSGRVTAVTSSTVIAEVHWLLKSYYKISKNDIVDFVGRMLSNPYLVIDNKDNTGLANSLFGDHNVKFIDALIASHPGVQDGSMTVVSYDKDFDVLGVKRLEPREVLGKTRA